MFRGKTEQDEGLTRRERQKEPRKELRGERLVEKNELAKLAHDGRVAFIGGAT